MPSFGAYCFCRYSWVHSCAGLSWCFLRSSQCLLLRFCLPINPVFYYFRDTIMSVMLREIISASGLRCCAHSASVIWAFGMSPAHFTFIPHADEWRSSEYRFRKAIILAVHILAIMSALFKFLYYDLLCKTATVAYCCAHHNSSSVNSDSDDSRSTKWYL